MNWFGKSLNDVLSYTTEDHKGDTETRRELFSIPANFPNLSNACYSKLGFVVNLCQGGTQSISRV